MGSFTKREQIVILVIVFIIIFSLSLKFLIKGIMKNKDLEISTIEDIIDEESELEGLSLENDGIIMVHISGQVYKPGLVELREGDRVKDAVNLAGGLKKDADLDRINLAKKLVDEEKIYIPKVGEDVDFGVPLYANEKKSNKININTCSLEELISLPGIGEVTANKIIEYRKSNPFKNIEEIKNVSGIGDKKFEAIKDLISVKWKDGNYG